MGLGGLKGKGGRGKAAFFSGFAWSDSKETSNWEELRGFRESVVFLTPITIHRTLYMYTHTYSQREREKGEKRERD